MTIKVKSHYINRPRTKNDRKREREIGWDVDRNRDRRFVLGGRVGVDKSGTPPKKKNPTISKVCTSNAKSE